MFKPSKIYAGVLIAISGSLALTAMPAAAQAQGEQKLDRVEVTGTRIKRADAEGALPVTVIKREEIEASGAVTVSEFMRSSNFSSAGNFRPQSGSSAQSYSGIDLRGLGDARTLVLLDGRRLPKAPQLGDSVDLNTVPMAAVERIEILTDGASAIYGSDAIGGVVNIVTRKDFEGIAAMVGYTNPETAGGDRNEMSAIMGFSGDKGRMIMGMGATKRGMVFTRQRPWGSQLGVTSFGNNYFDPTTGSLTSVGNLLGDASKGCTDANFYATASGTCSFNFNAVNADEAELESRSFFARGEYRINDNWNAYLNTSVTNTDSFGRYAPTPVQFGLAAGTVLTDSVTGQSVTLAQDTTFRHRTAAAGNRDTTTDNTVFDITAGLQGKLGLSTEVDLGVRTSESKYAELGRNYVVRPVFEQMVASGKYDIFNPSSNSPDVLKAITATINRDSLFKHEEVFGTATFYDLFKLGGGSATLLVGADHRRETYADIYDSLQEAGLIEGSAGNSAAGDRKVSSATAELLLPLAKGLEVSAAGRFEKYSDYGSDFAPKLSVRWQPLRSLTLRASAGTGFRAPSLPVLTQRETYSAESVLDPVTCVAFGGNPVDCQKNQVQVDTYTGANASLQSEKSKQFALGAVWDATQSISLKLDYYNIKINDVITLISAQDLLDAEQAGRPLPGGLYVQRNANGVITRIQQGYANQGTLDTSGLDFSAEGRWKLANVGSFRHELRLSHVIDYKDNGDETVGDLGLPEFRGALNTEWKRGPVTAAWNMNYIGKNGTTAARSVGSYVTHDVQMAWSTPWGGKLAVGVLNAGNKQPELVAYDGRNFNFYLYDSYGRQPYVRYDQKF